MSDSFCSRGVIEVTVLKVELIGQLKADKLYLIQPLKESQSGAQKSTNSNLAQHQLVYSTFIMQVTLFCTCGNFVNKTPDLDLHQALLSLSLAHLSTNSGNRLSSFNIILLNHKPQ